MWKVALLFAAWACGSPLQHARAQGAGQRAADTPLEPRIAASSVDTFAAALDARWSYRHANGADFDAAVAALRKRVETGVSTNELGIELQEIIALGIDGHAGVLGYSLPPGGCVPFLIEPAGERFVAVDGQQAAFLADGFPF